MSPSQSKIFESVKNLDITISVIAKIMEDKEFSGNKQYLYLQDLKAIANSVADKCHQLPAFYVKFYFSYDKKFQNEHRNVVGTVKFVEHINDHIRATVIRFLLYRGWSLRQQAELFKVSGQAILDFYRKRFKMPANSRVLKRRQSEKLFDENLLCQAKEMNKTFGGIILSMFSEHDISNSRLKTILQERGFKIIRKPLSVRSERVRKVIEYVHKHHIYKGSKIAKFFGVSPQYINNILFRYGLVKKKKVKK